jgi:energy-coupling factor transporter ATP-binding protein EcfA2
MITGLRLDNFRGFVSTEDLTFGKINLFYGPNSGGKSTILRALSLLKQSFEHNQVDHQCILLPYSRDGVDLGSSTSLHHNLNTSVPFSLSLGSESRELFRLARPQQHTVEAAGDPSVDTPAGSVSPPDENRVATEVRSYFEQALRSIKWKMQWGDSHKSASQVFLEESTHWTLRVTIAGDEEDSKHHLEKVSFGNRHFTICASRVTRTSGGARPTFEEQLRNTLAKVDDSAQIAVLSGFSDNATRRRLSRLQLQLLRRRGATLEDELQPSGCFVLEQIDFSDEYEKALAVYFNDAREDIVPFVDALARDLEQLQGVEQRDADGGCSLSDPIAQQLREYFASVSRFFASKPDGDACLAWWKDDLKRSRLSLFGYSHADYDGDHLPPLSYWMLSSFWTVWRRTGSRNAGPAQRTWVFDGASQSDEIDDPVSLYISTVEATAKSLATVRDIGPDRSSAERVYRVEPRRQAAKDHVGRQAAEIPRILHDSPPMLAELNSWLSKVKIPYQIFVDPLEIRGGGGGQVRQTGLFEINAELAHNENARINICDVGHGVFKQLALPVQVFLGRKLIITIEEPETNVHPRLQAEIADLFIEAATKRGHQIFAEAHSEILSLRLQRRIAEGQISHEDVRIFYVHAPAHGPCEVLPLALDKHGTLLNEPPGGFFDEWLREV